MPTGQDQQNQRDRQDQHDWQQRDRQDQRDRFGDLLRTLRTGSGLTQEALAEASGSSVRSIREMERGRVRTPQRRTASLLADALRLDGDHRDRFLALAAREVRHPPPSAIGGVPGQLPTAVPDLAGRTAELAELWTQAGEIAAGRTTTVSLVVLHGPPGIGKTSLAVAAGHRLASTFPDGQLFVDLQGATEPGGDGSGPTESGGDGSGPAESGGNRAGVTRTGVTRTGWLDPAEALAGFLRSLGVPDDRVPVVPAERGALFRTLVRDRRLLIVLDNAADEAQVRPLLPAGRSCLVLVTSRRPLTGLVGAARVPLEVLDPVAGRHLLASIVGACRVDAAPAATDLLIQLCGGLPLALRIAGNRLASRPHWPVERLAGQLRDQRRRLSALTAGDLGIRTAFEVSYRQLDPAAAQVFRRASVIPGVDFDAELIAAAAGGDADTAGHAAEELVDVGLLLPAGDRYRFHDLVRLYAQERLDSDESARSRAAAHDRVVRWLLRRTEQAGAMFEPGDAVRAGSPFADHDSAGDWLAREAGNWLAALRDAARRGWHADVIRVARALHWYSDVASHRHAWDEVFSLAVTAAQAIGGGRDEAVLLNFLGWARYFCRHRYVEALAALDRALMLARRIGDRREEAWALTYSASIFVRSGRAAQAVDPCRRATALFHEIGYALGEHCARNVEGSALTALGRFTEAARLHRQVAAFYGAGNGLSSTGALVAKGGAVICLGRDLAGLGRWRQAGAEFRRAAAIFRHCGTPFNEGIAVYHHGLAARELGDPVAAEELLGQALAHFSAVSSPWWEAQTLYALAGLAAAGAAGAGAGAGAADARRLRRQALDRCGELDAPEARVFRATLRRELAEQPGG